MSVTDTSQPVTCVGRCRYSGAVTNGPTTTTEPAGTAVRWATDDAPGRRERKKRRTYDDLRAAALRLFSQRGFDETTTEDIAEAADVSQRTFFRHFASKEAVLYGDQDELRHKMRAAFDARPEDEPVLVTVRHALLSLASDHAADRKSHFLQVRLAAAYPSVSAHYRAVIQVAWERELIEAVSARLRVDPLADPRPEIIAGAAISALRVSTRRWTASGGEADLPALLGEAFDALDHLSDLA